MPRHLDTARPPRPPAPDVRSTRTIITYSYGKRYANTAVDLYAVFVSHAISNGDLIRVRNHDGK